MFELASFLLGLFVGMFFIGIIIIYMHRKDPTPVAEDIFGDPVIDARKGRNAKTRLNKMNSRKCPKKVFDAKIARAADDSYVHDDVK